MNSEKELLVLGAPHGTAPGQTLGLSPLVSQQGPNKVDWNPGGRNCSDELHKELETAQLFPPVCSTQHLWQGGPGNQLPFHKAPLLTEALAVMGLHLDPLPFPLTCLIPFLFTSMCVCVCVFKSLTAVRRTHYRCSPDKTRRGREGGDCLLAPGLASLLS